MSVGVLVIASYEVTMLEDVDVGTGSSFAALVSATGCSDASAWVLVDCMKIVVLGVDSSRLTELELVGEGGAVLS